MEDIFYKLLYYSKVWKFYNLGEKHSSYFIFSSIELLILFYKLTSLKTFDWDKDW